MNGLPPAAIEPGQRRNHQGQLEADAAGGNRHDDVATLEGRAVEQLAGQAGLLVAVGDPGLLASEVG